MYDSQRRRAAKYRPLCALSLWRIICGVRRQISVVISSAQILRPSAWRLGWRITCGSAGKEMYIKAEAAAFNGARKWR